MPYPVDELKHKLRDVKRIEISLRFQGNPDAAAGRLVWDDFFAIKPSSHSPRYPLQTLIHLNRQELKEILDEYFYYVYFRIYQENGLAHVNLYDPVLLSLLNLPAIATELDIKKRFRELAKKYHPDMGGDSEKFIQLMGTIGKLTGGKK